MDLGITLTLPLFAVPLLTTYFSLTSRRAPWLVVWWVCVVSPVMAAHMIARRTVTEQRLAAVSAQTWTWCQLILSSSAQPYVLTENCMNSQGIYARFRCKITVWTGPHSSIFYTSACFKKARLALNQVFKDIVVVKCLQYLFCHCSYIAINVTTLKLTS